MLLSFPSLPPFQVTEVIFVLQMLVGKILNCIKLFSPLKPRGKKKKTNAKPYVVSFIVE